MVAETAQISLPRASDEFVKGALRGAQWRGPCSLLTLAR